MVKRYIFEFEELLKILTGVPYSKKILVKDFDNNEMFKIIHDSINDKYVLETDEFTFVFDSAFDLVNHLKKNLSFTFLYAVIYHICDFDCDDEKIERLYDYLIKDRDNLQVKLLKPKDLQSDILYV